MSKRTTLVAEFPDNTSGAIHASNIRDLVNGPVFNDEILTLGGATSDGQTTLQVEGGTGPTITVADPTPVVATPQGFAASAGTVSSFVFDYTIWAYETQDDNRLYSFAATTNIYSLPPNTITWDAVTGATGYVLEVAENYPGGTTGTYTIDAGDVLTLTDDGTYSTWTAGPANGINATTGAGNYQNQALTYTIYSYHTATDSTMVVDTSPLNYSAQDY
jgi:hypothetical protein